MDIRRSFLTGLLLTTASTAMAQAQDPDARAAATEARMTDDEKMGLLVGIMPTPMPGRSVEIPAGVPPTAGYVPGVPRLGVPPLLETDAGLGVTDAFQQRKNDMATAMPSGLNLASTFNVATAQTVGATIGAEARAKGFNVLLGGGMNLARDPRNGRNFEYLGEDPLLAGMLAGAAIRGTQAQGVLSTIKHFALNGQETQRNTADSIIDEAALRESELLAFQIGIEQGQPAAVMCAYNLVNGAKACGNDFLLNTVLKRDWGYKGWVMSDWGAVDDVSYFAKGLDQQSGAQLDQKVWFAGPLKAEIAAGRVPKARVTDAVRRILRGVYAVGARRYEPTKIDYAANAKIALAGAQESIVVLKNDGILPLAASVKSILVVGGNADFGVLAGGGSSQVTPSNGKTRVIDMDGEGMTSVFRRQIYVPSSPLKALRAAYPDARISFSSGYSPEGAAAEGKYADMVIVFATKWEGEGVDSGSLSLPAGQDGLISQIAAANANVVVVLETGNPVAMPWLDSVKGVVAAWFPGQEGGQAIVDVLSGKINPSGRTPITFPRSIDQYPRVAMPGLGLPDKTPTIVRYTEGSDAGYRSYAKSGETPLFPFGHGLSYTRFTHSRLSLTGGKTVMARFTVTNSGKRAGADVPQLYLVDAAGKKLQRLAGFDKVMLEPGETRAITLSVDPRILADWTGGGWTIKGGRYGFALGTSAGVLGDVATVALSTQKLKP